MADVLLLLEPDGGNIGIVNGQVELTDSLETFCTTALFGGEEDDGGGDSDEREQWWGNWLESDSAYKIRSRTQKLLQTIPLIPVNLLRIQDAATLDLSALVDAVVAKSIDVKVALLAVNSISIDISIIGIDGSEYSVQYIRNGRFSQ